MTAADSCDNETIRRRHDVTYGVYWTADG